MKINEINNDVRNILFVEASLTGSGLSHIQWALKNGINVWFITTDSSKYKSLDSNIINHLESNNRIIIEDNLESNHFSQGLLDILSNLTGITGVICVSDRNLIFAAYLAKYIGAIFTPVESMEILRDKIKARQLFDELSISNAIWSFPESINSIREITNKINGPIVLKNNKGTGSLDIKYVRNVKEAESIYEEMASSKLYMDGSIMVEEYLKGPLVSVEVLVVNNKPFYLGYTDRQLGPLPDFCEISYCFPVDIPTDVTNEIETVISILCNHLNISQGFLHVEFIITDNGPIIVEVNPRLGGGQLSKMISETMNVSSSEMLCLSALGEFNKMIDTKGNVACTYTLYPGKDTVFMNSECIDDAKQFPFITDIIQNAEIGTKISAPRDYRGAICQICSEADTYSIAYNSALVASQFISVHLES